MLLAQLRDAGFKPADTNLFVQTITTLSASLASQTNLSSGMSEFVTSKRRESYLAHTSCPVGESVKRELLVAPGPDNLWLIQPLREKVVCTIKEALLLSSTAFLVSFSMAVSRGRSGVSGAGGYASPLDFLRPTTSGSRKESNRYRQLSVAPLAGVERRGRGTLGSGGLAVGGGYQIPFRWAPTLSRDPIPLPAYASSSIRGKALEGEVQALLNKGALELALLPSPGFYSRLFMVMKASGAWRPVIDLSTLNLRIQQTSFRMETLQSVLLSVRPGDWMVSLDLKDAYLRVPMHPDSRGFLRFMVGGKVYQFKVLCFGLSTAPQVFTRVMAPVSAILHRMGVRLCRYLADWLLQAFSREQVLLALRTVLQLCRHLGIVVNWEKSQVIPTQQMVYLGVILDSLFSGLLPP